MGIGSMQLSILDAERTLNCLIEYCNEHDGEVWLVGADGNKFGMALKDRITISYFLPIKYKG